jgi:hypothetical protein
MINLHNSLTTIILISMIKLEETHLHQMHLKEETNQIKSINKDKFRNRSLMMVKDMHLILHNPK